jgi:hypothetical protein
MKAKAKQWIKDIRFAFRPVQSERWQDRFFPGHISIGPVCVYGANAMHWAVNIRTRWGFLCAHPTTRTFGGRWPWYMYLSRDGTPEGVKETRGGFMWGGRDL